MDKQVKIGSKESLRKSIKALGEQGDRPLTLLQIRRDLNKIESKEEEKCLHTQNT